MTKSWKPVIPTLLIVSLTVWFVPLGATNAVFAEGQSAVRGQRNDKQQNQEQEAIPPDPLIQTVIRDLLQAAHSKSEESFREHLGLLREESGKDFSRLIPQLIYYSIRADEQSEDMLEAMFAGVIIKQLGIRDSQLAWALIPYLGTGDPEIEKVARDWLGGTEDLSPGRLPNYSQYRAFLEFKVRNGQEPPRNLVQYMYDSEPGLGILTLMDTVIGYNPKETKPILWGEHVVADVLWKWKYDFLEPDVVEPEAVEALRRLCQHPRWWVRLYVAEIMQQYAAFRSDDLIETLLTDPDESVRSVIISIVARARNSGS